MVCTWAEVINVIEAGLHMILYGPPGTGKTSVAANGDGCYSLTLTAETPAAELRGHYIPHGNKFLWHDGPAVRAWREGKRLILNEINEASGDVLTFLYALLDDPQMARMTLPTGETITPAAGFQAIATTNAMQLAQALPPALLDRFAIRILVDEPHPDALKRLPAKVRNVVASTLKHDDDRRVSIRQGIAYQCVADKLDAKIAAKAIFGERGTDIFNSIVLAIGADTVPK